MSSPIVSRLDAALQVVGDPPRKVYKRITTVTGGDSLLGRGGSVAIVDTLLYPQPLCTRVGDRSSSELVTSSGKQLLATDYELLISPTAITMAALTAGHLSFVLKDTDGSFEVLRMIDYERTHFQGNDIVFLVYGRSTAR